MAKLLWMMDEHRMIQIMWLLHNMLNSKLILYSVMPLFAEGNAAKWWLSCKLGACQSNAISRLMFISFLILYFLLKHNERNRIYNLKKCWYFLRIQNHPVSLTLQIISNLLHWRFLLLGVIFHVENRYFDLFNQRPDFNSFQESYPYAIFLPSLIASICFRMC